LENGSTDPTKTLRSSSVTQSSSKVLGLCWTSTTTSTQKPMTSLSKSNQNPNRVLKSK